MGKLVADPPSRTYKHRAVAFVGNVVGSVKLRVFVLFDGVAYVDEYEVVGWFPPYSDVSPAASSAVTPIQ